MATIDFSGKTAYMYDQDTDTWYAISGAVNTAASYIWTGSQEYQGIVKFDDVIEAKAGVNNFQLESQRDAALPSPPDGTVCFVQQTNTGSVINQIQYYFGGRWRYINDSTTLVNKTSSYTIALSDAGKTLTVDSSSNIDITVPPNSSTPFPVGSRIDFVRIGSGAVAFLGDTGVILYSKNSNKKISARYSAATIIKTDTNTWVLIGDLTA
jgi:hypothetical protein